MADVTPSVSVFEQVQLIAGLRWRILRNSLRKKNSRLDLIGLILTGVFSSVLVIGFCFAFYAGAHTFVSQGRLEWMALLFWVIFIFWQVFPVFVAGFGANFQFRTLLRFPLSLRAFYIIGLAYGFADFSALASVVWLLAMTAGATAAKPGVLPAMLLIVPAFMLLNGTIERLIGSWLERLLARRRTRELFLGLFILSMVSLNFVSPLMQRYGASARPVVHRGAFRSGRSKAFPMLQNRRAGALNTSNVTPVNATEPPGPTGDHSRSAGWRRSYVSSQRGFY